MSEPSAGVRESERDGLIAMLRQFGEAVVRSSHNAPNIPAHIEVMEALSSSRTSIMQLFDAQSARIRQLEQALRELVRLKDLKDELESRSKNPSLPNTQELLNSYRIHKADAWLAARIVLTPS